MNRLISKLLVLGTMTLLLINCAEKKDGGASPHPPAVAPPCPQGQSLINGTCSGPAVPVIVQGSLSYLADMGNGYNGGTNSYSVSNDYKKFLKKAMVVCERSQYSNGSSDCDSWRQGYNSIVVTVDNNLTNQAKVEFRSYPYNNGGIDWHFDFNFLAPGTFGQPSNPYVLKMNIGPINANAGFELRAKGEDGFFGPIINEARSSLIRVQIPNGHWGDNELQFEVFMDSNRIASGTLYKCSQLNCQAKY